MSEYESNTKPKLSHVSNEAKPEILPKKLEHSNFFFTEAPKKTSEFRSTEQTVKISVQFCDF
jgi:hypothetical protein